MFEESQKRISAMALVHEELYGSEDLSSVGMAEYVPRLVDRVAASADVAVDVEYDVEDVRLPVTMSIPCGLVLNELVMNAVKHAFRSGRGGQGGRLRVALARDEEQMELTVEDNGPGLPAGFDLESPATLGLTLITSLARQLAGDVVAENHGNGARFTLSFPLAEKA
jgi:two-component sensor histidine kinase